MIQMMDRVSELFRDRGALVSDAALPPGFDDVLAHHRTVMAVEAAAFHGERLRRHPDDYQPEIRKLIEEGLACSASKYEECKNHQQQLRRDMAAYLKDVDAILAPATPCTAPKLGQVMMKLGGVDLPVRANLGVFTQPISFIGLPVVAVPTRKAGAMPIGVQVIARPYHEQAALRVAAHLEKEGVCVSTPA